jgi:hypothetical protein
MFRSLFFNIGSKAVVILSQLAALIITNHIIGAESRGIFEYEKGPQVEWSFLF